jgi:DNA topoisomerase VI subunit A
VFSYVKSICLYSIFANRSPTLQIDCRCVGGVCIDTAIMGKDVEMFIQGGIKLILVIEKRGMLDSLCQVKIWEHLPCIIVASGGIPDASARRLVHKLANLTTVPVVAFTDWDPGGINICNAYRFGTIETAYECSHLTVPRMKWLGLRYKHIVEYVVCFFSVPNIPLHS